jgi:hypothetical protein
LLRNPDVRKDINDLLDTYDLLREAMSKLRTAPRVEVKAPRRGGGALRALFRAFSEPVSNEERRTAELKMKAREIEERFAALTKPLGILFPSLRQGRHIDRGTLGEPLPKLTPETVARFEELLATDDPPVSVIDDHGETYLAALELDDPHTLYLRIDLPYPQDVLLASIEQSVRQAINERSSVIKRATGRRHRSDKADFELTVYDQVTAGATFQQIATDLGEPVSSVKSAYAAACRNIGIRRPPKRQAPLVGFDPDTHFRTCLICGTAQTSNDMCGPASVYINQDQKSQWAQPFANLENVADTQ